MILNPLTMLLFAIGETGALPRIIAYNCRRLVQPHILRQQHRQHVQRVHFQHQRFRLSRRTQGSGQVRVDERRGPVPHEVRGIINPREWHEHESGK
jgi:hypothetical protein